MFAVAPNPWRWFFYFLFLLTALPSLGQGFVLLQRINPTTTTQLASSRSRITPTTSKTSSKHNKTNNRHIWRQEADPSQHKDYLRARYAGGAQPVTKSRDNLLHHYVYFCRLDANFVLVLNGMTQVWECRQYFAQQHHPSTKNARWEWNSETDHDDGPWFCRLPKGITETKRKRLVKRLDELIQLYGNDRDFANEERLRGHAEFEARTVFIEQQNRHGQEFRQGLREMLEEYSNNRDNDNKSDDELEELIWSAIYNRTQTDNPQDYAQTLQKAIYTAEQTIRKITLPPPPPWRTMRHSTISSIESRQQQSTSEPRPLSKFRRKRLEKQRNNDYRAVQHAKRPLDSLASTLQDAHAVLEEWRPDHSQNKQIDNNNTNQKKKNKKQMHRDRERRKVLLTQIQQQQEQIQAAAQPLHDAYWGFYETQKRHIDFKE